MAVGLYLLRGILLSLFLFIMSSNADAFSAAGGASNDGNSGTELPQLLPTDPNKNIRTIKLGETIRLEEMGPIILSTDGKWDFREIGCNT
jgi:hypothetical protein